MSQYRRSRVSVPPEEEEALVRSEPWALIVGTEEYLPFTGGRAADMHGMSILATFASKEKRFIHSVSLYYCLDTEGNKILDEEDEDSIKQRLREAVINFVARPNISHLMYRS